MGKGPVARGSLIIHESETRPVLLEKLVVDPDVGGEVSRGRPREALWTMTRILGFNLGPMGNHQRVLIRRVT